MHLHLVIAMKAIAQLSEKVGVRGFENYRFK
jgi:hypothetical protein